MGLAELSEVLKGLPPVNDPRLLVGTNTADDAGVYKLSDDLAIIQTVDFFPPTLDDPFTYGQVAAANSLSDVYAMGGTPVTVLNVVGWPSGTFPLNVLTDILRGGQDKVTEAGAVVAGGHTCVDRELKYGLSVTGVIHPDKILTNAGAKAGDRIILTKPLGIGVITTALKLGRVNDELAKKVGSVMITLNKKAAEIMKQFRIHAVTDVTGFGLMGHLHEMMLYSGMHARLFFKQIPILPEAYDFTGPETVPGGTKKNMSFLEPNVVLSQDIREEENILIHDAQTSGGLLICVDHDDAADLMANLHADGVGQASLIGQVLEGEAGKIYVEL
ncbi:selenide, water dikinase SelD [candidate division LCP-89 bacterium B3_LCP]|uniref:Selenide, water dikinase n=1 Tax=candidate division LCP-89 bacterium B3_LCP TaxID=2012998 RepID=A0A532V0A4_UNCL8|nr:MAG: selenide, water dikinase SelD [candidate division LCP-89 bacterium B3_LCP]